MFNELRHALNRARPTLLEDAAGVVALVVMLLVALHLPNLI